MNLEDLQLTRILSKTKIKPPKSPLKLEKKTRLAYSIDFKISRPELEDLIINCDIDFFSIDTTAFVNVKEYFEIIQDIQEISNSTGKYIGIIVELKCRKIKVEKFKEENKQIYLKGGQKIRIITDKKQFTDEEQIIIGFKELYKMLTKGDKIIINDNKASLTVEAIQEQERKKSKTRKNSFEQDFFKKKEIKNYINLMKNIQDESFNKGYEYQGKFEEIKEKYKVNSLEDLSNLFPEEKRSDDLKNEIEFLNLNERNEKKRDSWIKYDIAPIPKIKTFQQDLNLLDLSFNEENSKNKEKEREYLAEIEFESPFLDSDRDAKEKKNDNYVKALANQSEMRFLEKEIIHETDKIRDLSSIRSGDLSSIIDFIKKKDHGRKNEERRKRYRKQNIKKYEIVCSVDYDCTITNNSFLYIPNLNHKKFGVDLLTPREVAEISMLDEKKIDFICVAINDIDDINAIKDVLCDNSNLKLIASIPDIRTLKNIDEMLNFTSGVVLSRTFQIMDKNNYNTNILLTKNLISKCRSKGKPIYSFLDMNEDILLRRKQKLCELKDVMYNSR